MSLANDGSIATIGLFGGTIPEAAGSLESSLTYAESLPPPTDPLEQGTQAVILTEPASEPVDENTTFLPGTKTAVSDLVISLNDPEPATGVTLISDSDPMFSERLAQVLALPSTDVFRIEETGQLQTLPIGFPGIGIHSRNIQVQSDVVPEPGTLMLFGSGIGGLVLFGREPAVVSAARGRLRIERAGLGSSTSASRSKLDGSQAALTDLPGGDGSKAG